MKQVYPIILTPENGIYIVSIPDFNANTHGKTQIEALEMARDAIGLMGITLEDDNKPIPAPNSRPFKLEPHDIMSVIDIDFNQYRQEDEQRTVRRNVTIPLYLDKKIKETKFNVSRFLTDALKKEFNI